MCARILAEFNTAKGEKLSYGQAQKPLNVFLTLDVLHRDLRVAFVKLDSLHFLQQALALDEDPPRAVNHDLGDIRVLASEASLDSSNPIYGWVWLDLSLETTYKGIWIYS
jgi:hypothetical protein